MESNGSVSSPQDGPMSQWSLTSSSGPHYGSFKDDSLSSLRSKATEKTAVSSRHASIAIAVLCYIHLVNYMERYIIAGVLTNVQEFFAISDGTVALIQTVFICSILLSAPLFGYLGDRYNRKHIMIGGLITLIVTSTASSFAAKSYFWFLMLMRAIVGIGQASFITIAPTIIADLFTGAQRSTMICLFYIFVTVGSGLGFIVGSGITSLAGDWHWAFRVSPFLGSVGLVLLVLCPNPPRGAAETHRERPLEQSSYLEDVKYLLKNKSYVWSTFGMTASAFNLGALAFWVPTFLVRARVFQGLQLPCTKGACNNTDSFNFGVMTMVTGILGGFSGTALSKSFRDTVPHVDPLICGAGLLGSIPCIIAAIFVAARSISAFYVFAFFAETLVTLNFAVMADILLYIVIPSRRSTAEALQITVIHLLGDAGSPFLIGLISDAIQQPHPATPDWSFYSLQYSLVLCPVAGLLGTLFYFMTVCHINEDRKAVLQYVEDDPPPQLGPEPDPSVDLSNHGT